MVKVALSLLMLLVGILPTMAQDDPEYRLEVGVGAGYVNYLGDFNNQLTKNLQGGYGVVARYVPNAWMAVKMDATMGKLNGSSDGVKNYFPDYAGSKYTFSSSLTDVSLTAEYNFWPYGTGRDYRGARRVAPYIAAGIGLTAAKVNSTTATTFNLPVGVGVKYKVAERVNLALEWTAHFSLSDQLDGVADPEYVKSSGLWKNKDGYSMLKLTITYGLLPKCKTCNKD